jgi:hypothetical protein
VIFKEPRMANTQTLQEYDAAKWERAKAAVKLNAGIDIASDTGSASAKGITLIWVYDAKARALVVTLAKRSWYDPSTEEIEADIALWLGGA